MVGRSRHFFQIDDLPIRRATRLLLATDGISGLSIPPGMNREEFILNLFKTCSADEIPDRMLGEGQTCPSGWDDITIIAIDPSVMIFFSGCIIIGGTSSSEEGIFQEEKSQGLFVDRYAPTSLSDGNEKNERILLS